MKRLLPLLFPLLLAACLPEDKGMHGYVEGEFVMIAPSTGGILKELNVERGQQVAANAALFSIDVTTLTAQRDAAKSEIAHAESQLTDLLKGQRPEEVDIIIKQKEQAEAALKQAKQEYDRVQPLVKTGAVSASQLDADREAFDSASARLAEVEARLKTATMGAREDQVAAQTAMVDAAKQKLVQAEKTLSEAAPKAPVAAKVEETFYRPGEFVPAGRPVVSLLPPDNVKIRFFVPQNMVPQLRDGQAVNITCDGCTAPIPSKITFVASEAEFTPPVIYSVESRQKLVFMVEAKPDAPDAQLRPGLPVDILLEQK